MLACVLMVVAGLGGVERAAWAEDAAGGPAKREAPATLPRVDLDALQAIINDAAGADRVLVIDFWATWCAPCIDLFPSLHAAMAELGDKVRPITVTLDAPGRLEKQAIAFLDKHGALHDAYLLDPDSDKQIAVVKGLGQRWRDLVVPAILVYDREGKLAHEFFEGAAAEEIAAAVKALLEAKGGEQAD